MMTPVARYLGKGVNWGTTTNPVFPNWWNLLRPLRHPTSTLPDGSPAVYPEGSTVNAETLRRLGVTELPAYVESLEAGAIIESAVESPPVVVLAVPVVGEIVPL